MGIPLSFTFEDNGRFHDDLVLRIGDREWRCDSYYFVIDRGMLADREDASKVRDVLNRLLEQWREAVMGLREGERCYLPYDFSDQFTGWLRGEADGEDVKVQPGWADVNGYSFFPSDVGELLKDVPGFRTDGDEVVMTRAAFVRALGGDLPRRGKTSS